MKLTKQVFNILKNFATINPGIIIKAGSVIRTRSVEGNICAESKTDVEFPIDFCIFDLNEFLSTISIFTEPDLVFNEHYVTISEKKAEIRYYYSSPTVVTGITKNPDFPEGEIKFAISAHELTSLIRSSNILELDTLNICNNNNNSISLTVTNSDNTTSNTFTQYIDSDDVVEFSDNVGIEHLKMIPVNYDVGVVSGRLIHFNNLEERIKYWVAVSR